MSMRKPEVSNLLWELKFWFFFYILLVLSAHDIYGPNFDTSKIMLEMGKAEKKVHLYDIQS